MSKRFLCVFVGMAAGIPLLAQDMPRRATFRGGAGPDSGKCTIEVVVDGAAEVEIRGDNANLHNLSGQPPQWRRFECTGPLPANPRDFRFAGVDGRGRQTLMRDPRNSGGAAVVRIEDPDNGSEGYTFDIMWSNGGGDQTRGDRYPPPPPPEQRPGPGPDRGAFDRPPNPRDTEDWHRDRDTFMGRDDWRMRLFDRVRDDVTHIRSTTFPFGRDQYRLGRAVQELNDLQAKLARGFFDGREVDDVTNILGAVLRDNRLDRRDREILSDDLNRLQDFRQRHAEYGAR
jgi:hypothetical protein